MPDEPVSTPSGMDQWFHKELQTVREKYFAIVLALFHGLRWADFWDIYQAILDSRDILEDEDIKKGDYLFAQTDEELAAKAKARIFREEDQAAEIIEFEDEIYPKALLEMLRTRYRPRLVELLPGLGTLGEHRYWEIRARAAYAVAEVARIDFYRARRQVMEVWARDDRAYVRAAVGYSISRLMEDRVSDSEACKMLDEWSDAKRNLSWKLRWAAAAAYKQVGLDSPEIALPGLRAVARNDDIRVADAVIYALLVISFDDKLEPVLGEMRAWLAEDEGSNGQNVVPLVATLAFLALGNAYTGLAEDESDGDGEGNDDRLLVLLSTDAEGMWRPVVVDALASALKYGLMDEAFDVLKGWARETQENLSRFTAVRDIITDWYMSLWQDAHQIGMDKTWNRLRRWKQDQDTAVKRVAEASLSEIKDRVSAAPLPGPSGKKRSSTIVFG
jgi:hypothetical protein